MRGGPELRPVVSSLATVTAAGLPRLKTGALKLPGVNDRHLKNGGIT